MSVLILNREQIQEVIDMREVLEKVRGVYQLKSKGESVIWPLVNYEFEKENAATMRYSWNAVFRDLTPMQLELCSDEVYDELIRTEEIKRMPTFPEKGSMQEMDGVYVIKISEDYLIDE